MGEGNINNPPPSPLPLLLPLGLPLGRGQTYATRSPFPRCPEGQFGIFRDAKWGRRGKPATTCADPSTQLEESSGLPPPVPPPPFRGGYGAADSHFKPPR